MATPDLRRELNPPQLDAVNTTEGPLLVFAGAGSGKTRVITYRAAHIVTDLGVPPWRVMCVTFTNKATGEMKERLRTLLGDEAARELWIATFHATGAKLLRRYHDRAGLSRDFAIYDDSDQRAVMNRVYDELKIDESLLQPRAALGMIDKFKQEALTPAVVADRASTEFERRGAEIYANYEHRLAANNAVDFGDLLKKLVELLEADATVRAELQNKYRYLMVDEFQDTNASQYRILRALVGPEKNLCVVGDDDQAIYRWRGADVRNIQYFKRDFPNAKVIKLEQNYRSSERILRAANAVISKSHVREGKVLFTRNGEGNLIELLPARDEREEAAKIASRIKAAQSRGASLRSAAVFYRIHAQSRPLEEAMRAADVPYAIVGGVRFYERAEVKDLLAYLRMTLNPNDDVSFLRVVNQPARGIGKTTLDRLELHAREKKLSLWKLAATGDYPDDVGAAGRKKLSGFYALVTDLRRQAGTLTNRPADLASQVLHQTGYIDMLRADHSTESEARQENLRELIGSMEAYTHENPEPSLADYLERVSLSEETSEEKGTKERVSLMTVHSAKGLEFDTVFVTGLEEGMFPYKGVDPGADREEMEEERRLAYVAITRARKQLVLSYATFRQIFGTTRVGGPSRFLREIPGEVLTQPVTSSPVSSGYGGSASSGYGSGSGSGYSGGGYGGGGAYGVRRDSTPSSSSARARESQRERESTPAPVPAYTPMPGETRIEYDTPAGQTPGMHSFRRGTRVKHAKFGVGRVERVEPGAELKLMVFFPGHGEKKVLAEYVQPL